MTSQDILARAHDVIGEFGIARGAQARRDSGTETTARDPLATSFCSVGAVCRASLDLGVPTWVVDGPFEEALDLLRKAAGRPYSIVGWNDNEATDEMIKDTFRRAAGIPKVTKVTVEQVEEHLVCV